jgi:hypothetical protein
VREVREVREESKGVWVREDDQGSAKTERTKDRGARQVERWGVGECEIGAVGLQPLLLRIGG